MFDTIKRIYAKTGNKSIVANAVKKGWITEEQYTEITSDAYNTKVVTV